MSIGKSAKRALRQWAAARGYIVEPKRHLTLIAIAERLRQIFDAYAIETVIDVGANQGQYGAFLRERVGFTGRIVSFEPIPEIAEKLRARAASDGRWTVRECALGAKPGRLAINVTAMTTMSSFHPLQVDFQSAHPVVATPDVEVSTLDAELVGAVNLNHAYLKLDTQGFDLEVLKGASETIALFPALQTEISFQPFYRGMPTYRESLDAFGAHGFLVADLFLAAWDEKTQAAMEFDCIMVRPR
jgi:FkbM family methyltransferase